MEWFRKFFKRTPRGDSLFPGKRLRIDQILQLKKPTAMIIELSYGIADKIHKTGYDSLSIPEQVLHHVYWLESEVNNGGFHQYFYNSSGDYALDTPGALDQIGAHHTAKLLRRAIELFPGGPPPRDLQQRREQLDSLSEAARAKLEKLDSEFYEYHDPLEELQVKYMLAHQEQIQV